MKNLAEFDKLKELERAQETYTRNDQYLVIRLDGSGFSSYTKGIKRPFDPSLSETMAAVTKHVMKKFGATFAFQQSDEISLIWEPRLDRNQISLIEHPYQGRVIKLSTLTASYASIEFYKLMSTYKSSKYFGFDGRGYPCGKQEAMDSLKFRFLDCAGNAYQNVAQSMWSPKQLDGISVQQIKAKLIDAGVNVWQAYGDEAMLGVFYYKEFNECIGRQRIIRTHGGEMMTKLGLNDLKA